MAKIYQDAESFINDQYWSGTHDPASTVKIADLVQAKLEADNAAKDPEYYGHRMGVVHVSSLYGCLRSLAHQAIGSPKTAVVDARKLGVFKAGNLFEDFVVDSLGGLILNRQTEYLYRIGGLTITGRDDGLMYQDGKFSILEAKSVHSNSFWHRQREGTLVAWNNQIQLQTYLWLRRILPNVFIIKHADRDEEEILYTNLTWEEAVLHKQGYSLVKVADKQDWETLQLGGVFSYISKDDCQVAGAPVKFNPLIISEIVEPVIAMVEAAYQKVKPQVESGATQESINNLIASELPAPSLSVWDAGKQQWQINWLCKYNDWADHCYGTGWLLIAQDEVRRKNKESKSGVSGALDGAISAVKGE